MSANPSQLVPLDANKPPSGSLRYLFGLETAALSDQMVSVGEPAWRGRQLAEALYRQRIADFDGITTLPKLLRRKLADRGWQVGRPRIAQVFTSVDGTERYLVQGQGVDALTVAPGYHLCVEPGWLRCELPVLPYGETRPSAQSERG